MKNNKIYSVLPDGGRKEYDVILTFTNDDNNRDYIVYTDNSKDENGKLKIFASLYNPDTLEFLGNPKTQEEWNKIYRLLDSILLEKQDS